MTHDELLFKIYEIHNEHSDAGQEATKQYKGMIQFMQSLRAVVELHKPNKDNECSNCGWECGGKLVSYPCPTIEAIEKELR